MNPLHLIWLKVLADVSRKARHQVKLFVKKVLARRDRTGELAHTLSEARWAQ